MQRQSTGRHFSGQVGAGPHPESVLVPPEDEADLGPSDPLPVASPEPAATPAGGIVGPLGPMHFVLGDRAHPRSGGQDPPAPPAVPPSGGTPAIICSGIVSGSTSGFVIQGPLVILP